MDYYIVLTGAGVSNLGTGRKWGQGQLIGGNELPDPLLRQLVKDKAIRKLKAPKESDKE